MDSARDPYSFLKPASPWRWVPVVAVPAMIVPTELAVRSESADPLTIALYTISAAALALVVTAWFKIGSGDGYTIAVRKARATGGRRVTTHAGLALAMVALGAVLLVMWFATVVGFATGLKAALGGLLRTFSFPMIGFFLAMFGLQRPWDLEVVEGEHAGA